MDDAWHEEMIREGAVMGQAGLHDGVLHFGRPEDELAAITTGVAVVDLSSRTRIELTGADRASFLHNLATNEIRKLPPGAGCEAFFLNAKGHTLAFALIFANENSHVIETSPRQNERLMAHLDRYIIREDVQLADRTGDCGALLVAGAQSPELIERAVGQTPPEQLLSGCPARLGSAPLELRRVAMTSTPGFLLLVDRPRISEIWDAVVACGARPAGLAAFESARVEAGFPVYGQDITDDNLPQEVNRDAQAISFVKGCYIGQETVARIDALGHVNRKLVGIRFKECEMPAVGSELKVDGAKVGHITSASFSPRLSAALALGYVRRGHDAPGTLIQGDPGAGEVIKLPVPG